MHILIAPNAFKHSLDATEAASAIKEGLMQSNLDCVCECFPIGDGGDGTAHLIIEKCQGFMVETEVSDPLKRTINTAFGLIDDGLTAIIEMADASGLRLLNPAELDPLKATSFGTGEQVKVALDKGATKIVLGMGGSATVDGGTGILQALGIRFLDADGKDLQGLPGNLVDLERIDITQMDKRVLNCELVILCDVDNLLLGPNGSAAVFGPQKGATQEDVRTLNEALARLSEVSLREIGKDMSAIKYGGTAGGAAAGLYAFLNAKLVNGIDYFLELTRFEDALKTSNLVITGEGSIDEQTLQGKGPFGVAFKAKGQGLPVIGLAGKVPLEKHEAMQLYFDVLLSIGHQPFDLATALSNTRSNMIRTAREVGNLLAVGVKF